MGPRLRLLNTATWDGHPISGTRVKELLRHMTATGRRGSSTDALIETLWPKKLPAHPHKALQIVVSRARAQLGPTSIARTEHGYRLTLGADEFAGPNTISQDRLFNFACNIFSMDIEILPKIRLKLQDFSKVRQPVSKNACVIHEFRFI